MTYQPLRIGLSYCSETNSYSEYPIYSSKVYAEADALLNEILQGAENNDVGPEYYIREFM
jgi:hypothetical protein